MWKIKKNYKKNNVTYDGTSVVDASRGAEDAAVPKPVRNPLDSSVDSEWFANPAAVHGHKAAMNDLEKKRDRTPSSGGAYDTAKRLRSVFRKPVPVGQPDASTD